MAITAQQVKELRDATGAGFLDCKKALTEANGDFDGAVKFLKEWGLAAVAKRSERVTSEGRIFIREIENKVVVAEIVCETDFVANSAEFQEAGNKVLDEIIAKGYTEVTPELTEIVTELSATRTHENMNLSKVMVFTLPENSTAGVYIHTDFKTAGVTVVKGSTDAKVKEFARDCCMHLVAFTPAYMKQSDVPESYIEEQKGIFKVQMEQDEKVASKPENVKEGILAGKIKKHLAEICFVDQMFVKDDKKTVSAKLDEIGKEVGAKLEFGDISLLMLGK